MKRVGNLSTLSLQSRRLSHWLPLRLNVISLGDDDHARFSVRFVVTLIKAVQGRKVVPGYGGSLFSKNNREEREKL